MQAEERQHRIAEYLQSVESALEAVVKERDQLRSERDKFAEGIAIAATHAGIIDGPQSLSGPQLLLLCDDLARNSLAHKNKLRK